jgi:hypothetical protein
LYAFRERRPPVFERVLYWRKLSGAKEGGLKSRPAGLPTAVAALLALVAFACNGGGELSLEEYFQRVDKIGEQASLRSSTRTTGPPAENAGDEEIAAYARSSLAESSTIMRDVRDSFNKLKPPSRVKKPHDQFVDALDTTADAVDKVADELPDTLTVTDLRTLGVVLDTPELNEASDQLDRACKELQAVADEDEIDVDLQCD